MISSSQHRIGMGEMATVIWKFDFRRSVLAFGSCSILVAASSLGAPPASTGELIELHGAGNRLHAYISPQKGGEMVGLEYWYNGQWVELLYRGLDFSRTTDWDGKAPILWPATGRNQVVASATNTKTGGWVWKGKFYPISIHGFARDLPWQVVGEIDKPDGTTVTLNLSDSVETRKSYPFGFTITTDYTVGRKTLTIHQRVQAAVDNTSPMPFSIGNHMTYNAPLLPGGDFEAVKFVTPATRQILLDAGGLPTGQSVAFAAASPRPISELGTRKAVSLTGFPRESAWVKIVDPSGLSVTVSHNEDRRPAGDPVLFNLWADPVRKFFSPEPWAGKQNSLVTQDGTIELEPGGDFEWTITVKLD